MACSQGGSNTELLRAALSLVLKDEGFGLPSVPAERARKTAENLMEWTSDTDNKQVWGEFADELVLSLKGCFQMGQLRKVRKQRERMWERYHKLRSSELFKTRWAKFLESSVGCESCPIFFQFVSDAIMEMLIKGQFPVEDVHHKGEATLDYEEKNALRYTAGYTLRALKKKINRSAHPLKKELGFCLMEMSEEDTGDTAESMDESEERTRSVDRGTLIHVNDMIYTVFATMELVLRRYLNGRRAREIDGLQEVTEHITTDEDVLFGWSIVSASWGEEEAKVLLHMIAEHWMKMRGFSFASALVERYKQLAKKNVQKSKGVRKQLQNPGSNIKKLQVPGSNIDS